MGEAAPLSKELKEKLEGLHTRARMLELELKPVKGNFDAAHLREVNRRIFQDLPVRGFAEVTPGEYRAPVTDKGKDWVKARTLETQPHQGTLLVAYSSMDSKAQAKIEAVLKDANPEVLKKLPTAEFAKKMADIYTQCDYLHPFKDGNSRTLRAFTKQLATESGYNLDWERFGRTPAGRDVLYIARDLSVNKIAFADLKSGDAIRDIDAAMMRLEGNKNLHQILPNHIEPLRSIAFRELPAAQAITKHPELAPAYAQFEAIKKVFAEKYPNQANVQAPYLEAAKMRIQEHLQKGGIPPAPELKKAPPKLTLVQPISDRGRDR